MSIRAGLRHARRRPRLRVGPFAERSEGVDALAAACAMVGEIQKIVTREVDHFDPPFVSGMFLAGVAAWGVSSLSYSMGSAPLMAFIQANVPNQLQGRAFSLLNTVYALGAPVGLALATPLGESIDIRWLFILAGVSGGLVILTGFLSRTLRQGMARSAA